MKLRVKRVVENLAVPVFFFAFVFASCSEKQQLSQKDLKIAAGDLRTFALASSRMTELFDRGKITQIFYRNQSELLLERVRDTAKQLEGHGERPDQEYDRLKLFNLTQSLQSELEKLQHGNSVAVHDIDNLAQEATTIEDQLKKSRTP